MYEYVYIYGEGAGSEMGEAAGELADVEHRLRAFRGHRLRAVSTLVAAPGG